MHPNSTNVRQARKPIKNLGRSKITMWVMFVAILYSLGKFFIGSNGFWSYRHLAVVKKEKLRTLHKLEQKNMQYVGEINKLGGGGEIDMDYLDELARAKLNYAKPDEIVIVYGDQYTN